MSSVVRPPMRQLVGNADLWFITIDTLRYDVAAEELAAGRTPHLGCLVGAWEPRHTPGSFTYAAHQAFFAGFLPTPVSDPKAERLWAVEFPGNEDTSADTWFTPRSNVVAGLADIGYRTLCIGGVGFFNPATALGAVLPGFFETAYWETGTGVTAPAAFGTQLDLVETEVELDDPRPLFTFINVPTVHQPNRHHLSDSDQSLPDDRATHAAALRTVDASVPRLRDLMARRGRPVLAVLCSDHGTVYSEDGVGVEGHRLAHEITWTVPYAEVWMP